MGLLSKQDIEDAGIEELARLSVDGDPDAGLMLHASLSARLRSAAIDGVISRRVAKLLADMHAGIASGDGADRAMLVAPPSHRPPGHIRKRRVHSAVSDMVAFFEYAERHRDRLESKGFSLPPKSLSKTEIYAQAAKALADLDLTPEQVKKIYLAEQKRIGGQGR